jgi:hypothetical protein
MEVIVSSSWLTPKASVGDAGRWLQALKERRAALSCVANFKRVARTERSDGPPSSETYLEGRTPKADLGRNKPSRSWGEQRVERVRNPEDAA